MAPASKAAGESSADGSSGSNGSNVHVGAIRVSPAEVRALSRPAAGPSSDPAPRRAWAFSVPRLIPGSARQPRPAAAWRPAAFDVKVPAAPAKKRLSADRACKVTQRCKVPQSCERSHAALTARADGRRR